MFFRIYFEKQFTMYFKLCLERIISFSLKKKLGQPLKKNISRLNQSMNAKIDLARL